MQISNILMILAVLVGPVIAVQLTRFLDERREKRGRKLSVFKTLMSTRATRLSGHHVEALNMIDLEFSAKNRKEKAVIDAWKSYLDSLCDDSLSKDEHGSRARLDLFTELLQTMATVLDYEFDKTQLKNAAYSPVGHNEWENDNLRIRKGLIDVLDRKKAIGMHVTNLADAYVTPNDVPESQSTNAKG